MSRFPFSSIPLAVRRLRFPVHIRVITLVPLSAADVHVKTIIHMLIPACYFHEIAIPCLMTAIQIRIQSFHHVLRCRLAPCYHRHSLLAPNRTSQQLSLWFAPSNLMVDWPRSSSSTPILAVPLPRGSDIASS
ncbi:hypothetical protein E1B28_011854 [Marasmius oreades]|uniref:Uncharacterized protein n=1 Tax=Marasmius oreades TaxID=181124 RepID=A0A9P7UQ17_9AGAR|nr:uncharacterized protein E1B28_011854 [Marasmius oreades]KAG7090257.1 hypothetical protein E1B28_011854 [Marasmius oreades]